VPLIFDTTALPAAYVSGEVPAECVAYTAATFDLSPQLLLAIMKAEGGRVGQESRNSNGTHDLGPNQVNSTWLPILAIYHITLEQVRDDGCINEWVGGWILRLALDSTTGFWRGVGAYHSRTTSPGHDINGEYAVRVSRNLDRLNLLQTRSFGLPGSSETSGVSVDSCSPECLRLRNQTAQDSMTVRREP
jgi:hypothetical protein